MPEAARLDLFYNANADFQRHAFNVSLIHAYLLLRGAAPQTPRQRDSIPLETRHRDAKHRGERE